MKWNRRHSIYQASKRTQNIEGIMMSDANKWHMKRSMIPYYLLIFTLTKQLQRMFILKSFVVKLSYIRNSSRKLKKNFLEKSQTFSFSGEEWISLRNVHNDILIDAVYFVRALLLHSANFSFSFGFSWRGNATRRTSFPHTKYYQDI